MAEPVPRRRGAVIAVVLALAILALAGLVARQRANRNRPPAAVKEGSSAGGAAGGGAQTDLAARPPGTDGGGAAGRPTGKKVLQGRWGSQPGEFGRRHDSEAAPEAPMSMAIGRNGEVLVLDQVNARVQRFKADGTIAEVSIGNDTAQDLAVDADGDLWVLDRLADSELVVYGEDGQLKNRIPVVGGPIEEGGGVTGVFTDASGTCLEREHTECVRVADGNGVADPERGADPGRPSRDGQYFLWAAIADGAAGVATVRVFNRDGVVVWQRPVSFPSSIVHLLLLDSDLRGYLYLGAYVGREEGTELVDTATVVIRLRLADGADAGVLILPGNDSADEVFRELVVGDDGAIYQMLPGEDGVVVTRYEF